MTDSVVTKRTKLSRRNKSRAKRTLYQALDTVVGEIGADQFLRSHLFLNKPAKDTLVVGGYIVSKKGNGTYNVYKKNLDNLLYEDLYSFDAAMALAEAYNSEKLERIDEILRAEEMYANAYNDMTVFKYNYDRALETNTGNACVFADRYALAREKAQTARKLLKRFRIGAL